MTKKLTSKEPIPLRRGEYLDCPNVCDARSAKWHNGDAICPECGEPAVVYDRATYFRTDKEDLSNCLTPQAIERYFQRGIKADPSGRHVKLRQACNARALEIATRFKRGHLLARRLDKGHGNSARYAVGGKEYRTGSWGNGAGYRWAMADFERWYERLLRDGGLRSKRRISLTIEWVTSGYLWRGLRELVT